MAILQEIINWAQPFISNLELLNDSTVEPGVSNANNILQTMLGSPLIWEWNRSTTSFTCVPGQTDYSVSLIDSIFEEEWGFIESAYLVVPNSATQDAGKIYQLEVKRSLEVSSDEGRPNLIQVFQDNLLGEVTFRVQNAPDQDYEVVVTYQLAPTELVAPTDIVPLPNKMLNVFRYGFLGMALFYSNDPRWREMNQKFIAGLIGYQQGLDDGQKNIFVTNWLQLLAATAGIQMNTTQGYQARGNQ